jgi:TonB-dependent Receptor Plug Domain
MEAFLNRRRSRLRRLQHCVPFAVFGSAFAWLSGAQAQTPVQVPAPSSAQSAAQAHAPVLRTDAPVSYPPAAIAVKHFETIDVVLLLTLDAQGLVTGAVPERADEHGFSAAAVDAARKLVFTPASRDGVPIASKIKYKYHFVPPSPVLALRILDRETNKPLAAVDVTLTGADGTAQTIRTDAKGSVRVESLAPGLVRISVAAEEFDAIASDETLSFAEETSIVLRATRTPKAVVAEVKAGEDVPEEVSVRGERPPREVVKRSLTASEMAQIPGTNGDALRAVQSLPGVARPPPFFGQLVVRGSENDDTVIYVDGTPIPLIYHFGGLSSVIPTEATEKLDFYPGNFSSVYGRGMGGVVDVSQRAPKQDKWRGMLQLDLVDARFVAEAPLGKGWAFRAAGRRSWFDVWLGPVLDQANAGISTLPRYYDGQFSVQKDWSANHSLRLSVFGADDAFKATASGGSDATTSGGFGISTKFWRAQAVYRNRFSEDTEARATAAFGNDTVSFGIGTLSLQQSTFPASLRVEVTQKVEPGIRANTGVDLLYTPYDLKARLPISFGGPGEQNVPGARLATSEGSGARLFAGAYTEWELTPWKGTRIVPGFRADYTSTTERTDLSPRINVRQALSSDPMAFALKGALGVFFQPPSVRETDKVFGRSGLRSKQSIQADIGFDKPFSEYLKLSFDFYYKTLDRLVVNQTQQTGQGRSFGAETMLRYQGSPRFFGWLSYTLSRSERRDDATREWSTFANDQTHVLTVLGSYELGRGWRLGGRYRAISGNPYTSFGRGSYDSTTGSYNSTAPDTLNTERMPLFHQLDVRADKVWDFGSWKLSTYLDIQNLYNYRAVEAVTPNYDYTRAKNTRGLTIFPSLGIRGEL